MIPSANDIFLYIGKMVTEAQPSVKLLLKGVKLPEIEKQDDCVALEMLGAFTHPTRRIDVTRTFDFQLTVYSRSSEFRVDRKFNRIYELAEIYYTLFNQKNYFINNACVWFDECKIAYLDLRSSADFSKTIYQNSPPMNFQAAVISMTAYLITSKG